MFFARKSTFLKQPINQLLKELKPSGHAIYMLYDAAALNEDVYKTISSQLLQYGGAVSLFEHTQDGHLKDTAAWLVGIENMDSFVKSHLYEQMQKEHEQTMPFMSWLNSTLDLVELQAHLASFLDVRLRNGKEAIIRFYDPRVLPTFYKMLNDEQTDKLMSPVSVWAYYDVKQNQYVTYQGVDKNGTE